MQLQGRGLTRRIGWLLLGLVIGLGNGASVVLHAQESVPIPEPDITFIGNVPAGSVVSLERSSDVLDSATGGAAGPYVLNVKLVQPVITPTPALPPDGSAYVGDRAMVLVNGVAQGQVTLAERGAIYELDIPEPATTPSPNAVLSPAQVVPSIGTRAPTFTRTPTATGPTQTVTPSRSRTASATPSASPTPTVTPGTSSGCVGDCNGVNGVTVEELVRSVNIALQRAAIDQCTATDRNDSGTITVDELVAAVNNALRGCPE